MLFRSTGVFGGTVSLQSPPLTPVSGVSCAFKETATPEQHTILGDLRCGITQSPGQNSNNNSGQKHLSPALLNWGSRD